MKAPRSTNIFLLAAAACAASSCGLASKIKVPFTGGEKTAPVPSVPFDVSRPLAMGHTLELKVYRNLLSRSRLFSGSVTVDEKGLVHFKGAGDVRVGGRSALEAAKAIEAAFRNRRGDSTITVQLSRISNVPLVTVTGAVRTPAVIRWFDDMTASAALPYVRGRTGGTAVYVMRDGARNFHVSDAGVSLKPGDVVNFSSDL